MGQLSLGSLVFETVPPSLQPASRQSASCCLHGLPDLMDGLGGVSKIQDAHRIGTVVGHQPLQPLCSILHGTHRCGLLHPTPVRFHQRCLPKTLPVRHPCPAAHLLYTSPPLP